MNCSCHGRAQRLGQELEVAGIHVELCDPTPVTKKSPLPVPCALFENPLILASWPHRRALVFIRPTQPGHSLRRYLLSAHWARAVLPVQEDQSKVPAVTGCTLGRGRWPHS